MIPKMGRDSQGSTLVMFFKFIYCFIYFFQVHLLLYLYSSSSFIALFMFKVHLLLYLCFLVYLSLYLCFIVIYCFIYAF